MAFNFIDSFVIYMCVEGNASFEYGGSESVDIKKGETVLIPASVKNMIIQPGTSTRLLEIYIK